MLEVVKLLKINEAYNRILAEPSIMMEASDYFTFEVPGARFSPKYKSRFWDGKIKLCNALTGRLYGGLNERVAEFCRERGYELQLDDEFDAVEFSLLEAQEFIESLDLPVTPHDYQVSEFVYAVRNGRGLFVCPTASGKSLIIYMLCVYFKRNALIVVPTTGLVSQMKGDFVSYGCDPRMIGDRDDSDQPIIVSTWQGIYKKPAVWFDEFGVICGDEAHNFQAKSLVSIMTKATTTSKRFGFTGSLSGMKTHRLVLEGLFGPVRQVVSTAQLQERKILSPLTIKCVVLRYPDVTRQQHAKDDYRSELDFLVGNDARNRFIRNLALSLKGNTIILFTLVDGHGKILYDMINENKDPDRKIFFIHGGIRGEDRNAVRAVIEDETDSIAVASFGTFSVGVNIRNVHNVIFASPSKSRIRNTQSIGRGLRLSDNGIGCTLYDISDDLTWKTRKNFTLNHFLHRVNLYNEEGFEYRVYPVSIKG